MTQRITQDPDPCAVSKPLTLCYNIAGASLPVTLTVTWDPGGQSVKHTVTNEASACFVVTVPWNATGGTIEDSTAQSDDFAIQVIP